jgi:serine protease Do
MPNTQKKQFERLSRLLGAMVLCCGIGVGGMHANAVAGEAGVQRLDAKQLAELEAMLQKRYAQLAPAVVRLINPEKRSGGFSGVIISADGGILTCAHHRLPPNTKVLIELADGRKLNATVRGSVKQKADARSSYYAADVGLVVLDERGEWPSAGLGLSAECKPGALCLTLGFPNVYKSRPPLLRLGRFLAPHAAGLTRTTCRIHPGDSGGPLFDLDGCVVGVHTAMESLRSGINWHSPIESFLAARDRLRRGEDVELAKDQSAMPKPGSERGGAWEPAEGLRKTLTAARDSTVEVVGNGKVVALGLIVADDGWVVTKRTELMGPRGRHRLTCRLADGRSLDARVLAESRRHDLALLKLAATGLPVVHWAKQDEPRVGQLIAAPGLDPQQLDCGVIGAAHARNPAMKGDVPIRVQAAPDGGPGVVFAEFWAKRLELDEARELLKPGDVITHLDDVPTPTVEEFARVRKERTAALDAFVGEWTKLTVRRAEETRHVYLPLLDATAPLPFPWQLARWNVRRDGFPDVLVHDGAIAHDRCGGAVVDRSGAVVAVNIARADPIQTYAIPAAVVREAIATMKARVQGSN